MWGLRTSGTMTTRLESRADRRWLRWTARTLAAVMLAWSLALPAQATVPAPRRAAPPASAPRPGLTQTPDARLRRLIEAKEAAPRKVPDARFLTAREMASLRGRGPYRYAGFSGTLPWQRTFHDVNLNNGNLFKSFTDVQVAPGKGAGLALQRTYNSNDDRVGPFGIGWTHAYDIRIEEAGGL